MKKALLLMTLLVSLVFISACKKEETFSFNFYEYMYTFISISVTTESLERAEELETSIKEIYRTYHELTNSHKPLSHNSGFKENLYSINQRINEDIEIDFELYEILEEADRIKTLTDGYFDISIGKMVTVWKDVILDEENNYLHTEIPKSVYEGVLENLEEIELIDEPYTLSEVDNKYFVRLNHEDVSLDLGAMSKGYATQIVHDFLKDEGVEYFSISAGSSSISLGKRIKRKTELFHIDLLNPVSTNEVYGLVYIKNKSITTSGNFEQYVTYEGYRYHHVISPKSKMPVHYYHTVTVFNDDAGVADALSTALFSMPPEVFNKFLDDHQNELGLELVRYNYDETISTFLTDTVFEVYE